MSILVLGTSIDNLHDLRVRVNILKKQAEVLRHFIITQGGGESDLYIANVSVVRAHSMNIGEHRRVTLKEKSE